MKKKTFKKKRSRQSQKQQKIDVVLESLLNLETVVRELIKKVEQLQYSRPYYPQEKQERPKYWPVDYPNYKDSTWDAINNGWQ